MVTISGELELKDDVDEDLALPSPPAAVQDGGGAAAELRRRGSATPRRPSPRCSGRDAGRLARAVTGLQEVLGEHQDVVVTRERSRDLVEGDVGPALAWGRPFEREQVHAAASVDDVADARAAVRAGTVLRWLG